MIYQILSAAEASITELKRNPMGTVKKAMVLPSPSSSATNQPSTACHQHSLPYYIERAKDAELNRIADERMALLDKVSVSLDESPLVF